MSKLALVPESVCILNTVAGSVSLYWILGSNSTGTCDWFVSGESIGSKTAEGNGVGPESSAAKLGC